jgi:zinc protease
MRCLISCASIVALVAWQLSCVPAWAQQPQKHAAAAAATTAIWPQTRSDLKADPAVRFGTLANGMRYAVLKNATPLKQISMRLRINAGSIQEEESQRGLAHLLEHMAFRGSRAVPDGEVKKSLERLGLKMGADTNAATEETQTVYKFDLAGNDIESIAHGLLLMREICDGLTLDQNALTSEKGVVLSEWRLSDTPMRHYQDALLQFLMPQQRASQRMPIGKKPAIETITVATMRDFYRKWYRPERATFVVTGDFDPDAMEQAIRDRFTDWKSTTPRPRDPDFGKPASRRPEARVFTEPGAPSVASIHWLMPYDTLQDSFEREKRDLIRQVGFAILNRRMQEAAAAGDRKFPQAGIVHNPFARSADFTTLYVGYEPDEWRPALLAAEELRRQAVEAGVQQAEVDREVTALRAQFRTSAAGAVTRTTPFLAEQLVSSVDREEVFTSPAQDVLESDAIFNDLTAATVTDALRTAFAANGPLAFVGNPSDIADGDARANAALSEAERATVTAAAAVELEVWPYTQFGEKGTVQQRLRVDDLDYTQLRFANGVRLNVKSTQYRADQILVHVNIAGGRALLPTDRASLEWAMPAVVLGGTGKLDYQAMQRALVGKDYRVNFSLEDSSVSFSGETTPGDLNTQLQVLTAYVTDPAFRPEAFDQVRSIQLRQMSELQSQAIGVAEVSMPALVHGGDARWSAPTEAGVVSARVDDLKGLVGSGLATNPIEITVVGDVSVDQAIEAVAKTFGALPARAAAAAGEKQGVRFPHGDAAPVVFHHHGAADQGISVIAWPTTDVFADIRQSAVRQVLSDVFAARLFDTIRATAGTSYSPTARSQSSGTFADFGYFLAAADVPPSKSPLFYDVVSKIASDLKTTTISDDELTRARNPAVVKLVQQQQSNTYWAGMLAQSQSEPRFLDLLRHGPANLLAVSIADVQTAAGRYLIDDNAFKVEFWPEGQGAPAQ